MAYKKYWNYKKMLNFVGAILLGKKSMKFTNRQNSLKPTRDQLDLNKSTD